VRKYSVLSKTKARLLGCLAGGVVASVFTSGASAAPPTVTNPLCPTEIVFFDPGQGQDIIVPKGFKVSVFVSGLNMPTGLAFRSMGSGFEVYVLESGHGLPSQCNDEVKFQTMFPGKPNPFTPDVLVFDQNAVLLRTLGKPTTTLTPDGGTNVFQPHGPAVDIAFQKGLQGGTLFGTDSNQSLRTSGNNNSSRIVTIDAGTGKVTPFIAGLPTGDHPTEQLAFDANFIYWSQGSTTNSGVVGRDNGGGTNQPDIPCQDIVLSNNVFDSGGGVTTSGYMPFGKTNPGGTIKAFTDTQTGIVRQGVCDGAILRAKLNDPNHIEPFSWGYRNGYAIRFAPDSHPLKGAMIVGEDGPDERGARPSNGAPDALHIAQQNPDGTPDYHGWPDRFGFLASSQAVFNPIGGPSDDLCVFDPSNPPSKCTPASLATILKEDVPIPDVLAFPPQTITSPLAIEAADSSFTGIDFAPKSFVGGPVLTGAALYALEGDFGFSPPNATAPAPEVGHEIKLINFVQQNRGGGDDQKKDRGNDQGNGGGNDQGNGGGNDQGSGGGNGPIALKIQGFARNNSGDQAFLIGSSGFNRPTNIRFGPDGCAYVVDYGAVRDNGEDSHFVGAGNGPLVQIPGTGVIFKICKQ